MSLKNFLQDYGILITSLTTLFASLVALFKEWINSKLIKPKIFFRETEKQFAVVCSEKSDESSDVNDVYVYEISLQNLGKLKCNNFELYCERIEYKGKTDVKFNEVEIKTDIQIKFKSGNSINVVPNNRPIMVSLFSISNPNNISESKNQKISSCLMKIGDYVVSDCNKGGVYRLLYRYYSENCKSSEVSLEVTWNGEWNNSVEEFKKHNIEVSMR